MTPRSLAPAACLAAVILCGAIAAPAAPAGSFAPPPPLRIGVGGDYADGLDGMLAARGLPHERVFPWELADPKVLARFDVLFLSCPIPQPGLDEALEAWVRGGGRAYVEVPRDRTGKVVLPGLVSVAGPTPKESDAVIGDAAFAAASGLPAGTPIDLYDLVGGLLRPQPGTEARSLARFCPDQGGDLLDGGEALLAMPLGRGEFVFSGPPLAFCCFRGEATQPLLGAAIAYLLGDRGRPRLTSTADEPGPPGTPPEVPIPPAGTPPDGFDALGAMAANAYNVTATLASGASTRGPATVLLLDGQAAPGGAGLRPCLWLAFGAKHVQLRAGATEEAAPVASAEWQPPTEPVELLVRRRPGLVSVVLAEREVLRTSVREALGGLAALKPGLVPLAEAYCQEVAEPVLFDNFMREPDDPTEWAAVSGKWTNVGVGSEEHSVNGFFLRGESREAALTTLGDWFWEEYAVSAAVRPESAAACGIAALKQANGDLIAFIADITGQPWPTLRLVRVADGRETPLAQRTGGLAPEQWHRLALRVHEGRLEGLIDGEAQLSCASPEARGGGIGLLVRGGAARFDDVLVHSASKPLALPGGEGTPVPEIPPYVGAEDHLTWANPAAAWAADPARPSMLWHPGDFPGEVSVALDLRSEAEAAVRRLILAPSRGAPETEWLAATVRTTPGAAKAWLELTAPGAKPSSREAALSEGQRLTLSRVGDAVRVSWGETIVQEALNPGALRRLAVEVDGPPIAPQHVRVSAPTMREYVFGAAPTDWFSSAGTWEVAARWACDTRWSFFSGTGEKDAAVWLKRPIAGDVVIDYYVGVKMDAPGGDETVRCRDLNTVLCGDRRDPRSGYSFILGGDGGVKTQLLRAGVPVAESAIRVPPGFGVHQEWFHIRAARLGNRVELDFEGRPVFRWEDPDPLPGGHAGLWTHHSGIVVSRVSVYG